MNENEDISTTPQIGAGERVQLIEEGWTGTVSELDGETAKIILDEQYKKQQEMINPDKGYIEVSLSEIQRDL